MEDGDLPGGLRLPHLAVDPLELRTIEPFGVDHEEPDIVSRAGDPRHERRRLERVVALAAHVERRVERLVRKVVVADGRVELHAVVQQRLVGQLESIPVVLRRPAVVDVVAEHDDEVVGEHFVEGLHLRRDFVLRLITAAGIADGGEADRAWFSRKREDVGGRTRRCRRRGGDRGRRLIRRRRLTPARGGGDRNDGGNRQARRA